MMKKILLSFAAIAMLASCSKEEANSSRIEGDPSIIAFNSFTAVTKVADAVIANLQNDVAGFNVYATDSRATPLFIINAQAYKYTAPAWGWTTDQKWSVIETYPANFYATYPNVAITDPAAPKFAYNVNADVPSTSSAINTQVDLLAANQSVNAMPGNGTVPFAFQHILSKIDFRVAASPQVKTYIQSIKIWNAGVSATYTFGTGWSATTATTNSFTYRPVAAATNAIAYNSATAQTVNSSSALMMMPHITASTPWNGKTANINTGTYVEVVWRMTDAAGTDIVGFTNATAHPNYAGIPASGGLWVKGGFPITANWAAGTYYTYTIVLDGVNGTGGTLIGDKFFDDNGNEVALIVKTPDTGDVINPDDPIIDNNKVIKFNVSVDPSWAPGGDVPLQ